MKRPLILAFAAAAALLGAGAAHAGNVQWSIGIALPPVATVIGSGPAYYPEPVRYAEPAYRPWSPVFHGGRLFEPPVVYRAPRPHVGHPVVIDHRHDSRSPRDHDRDNRWGDRDHDRHEGRGAASGHDRHDGHDGRRGRRD